MIPEQEAVTTLEKVCSDDVPAAVYAEDLRVHRARKSSRVLFTAGLPSSGPCRLRFRFAFDVESAVMDALALHRFHFAFTITYHYLFPQLTMGLALLIVILKTMGLRTGDEHYNRSARFWAKIFAINFAMGVVTGIPMEFQFGTNWAPFSKAAGGVIGQTLAMEGVFSFFLESTLPGPVPVRREAPGAQGATGGRRSWSSWDRGSRAIFIIATDAWMQHPVGYALGAERRRSLLSSFWALLLNPWTLWQYLHNMIGVGGHRRRS